MTSADFCRITTRIPSRRAMPRTVRCLFARLRRATRRSAWALMIQFRPFWNNGSALHRYVRQISPGKNAMFPCTSAAFTLSAVSDGLRHEVPTRPQTRPSMQFLSVASHFCAPASRPFAELMAFRWLKAKQFAFRNPAFTLQTSPRDLALALAFG